jgi:nicotinate-nucleotide pyrophosphorylase (carboxylating)
MANSGTIPLPPLEERLRLVLREDLGRRGDLTSRALVPWERQAVGEFLVKANGVLSGVRLLPLVFRIAAEQTARLEHRKPAQIRTTLYRRDGARVRRGDIVARVTGPARVLLAGERTALNLICHLSGVATTTSRFVEAVKGTRARILDTRKTTPLWRDLEKSAVCDGGGMNHRFGLHDMILIKDNHLALWGVSDPASAVRQATRQFSDTQIEVEVTTLESFKYVCEESRPDFVLLDNFTPGEVRRAVAWLRSRTECVHRPLLEASGGIRLETVRAYARAGVDRISLGALTHSAPALDVSLEILGACTARGCRAKKR